MARPCAAGEALDDGSEQHRHDPVDRRWHPNSEGVAGRQQQLTGACSLLHAPCASSQVGLRTMATRSHVGAQVDSAAVREVAGRLLEEGRSRLDTAPESALVALRQAFSLEQQFGVDGERLHRTAC